MLYLYVTNKRILNLDSILRVNGSSVTFRKLQSGNIKPGFITFTDSARRFLSFLKFYSFFDLVLLYFAIV